MKRLSSNKWLLGAGLILLLLTGYWIFGAHSGGAQARARIQGKVERGELIQRSTIAGTVTPLRKTVITAPYAGYVRKVYIKLGDKIKAGDPVASVSPTLVSGESVFPLRSPFNGKVVQVNKSEGEYVKLSDSVDFIARIDDLSRMYVDANVPELDRVKMKVGLEAIIRASAILDKTYKGVVQELTFAAREQDRYGRTTAVEFPMRLEILDFDEMIQPGMSVIVDIITLKKDNVLRLRHEFIGKDKDNYFLTLADGTKKSIKIGAQNEEYTEILDPEAEGLTVQKVDFSTVNEKP